jgi:hypothetical protein
VIISGAMKNSRSAHHGQENFSRALLWLVALGLALYAALTVWLAFGGMFFPYQLDYGEGIVLWFVRQLAHGQAIYLLPGASYASSNYPPVFLLLGAALDGLFGASYVWGRFLNFAATLLVTAFIVRFVRGETRDVRAALAAGLFFFGSTFVYHWAPLFRVDMPGVAFTLAGVFCVWRWERGSKQTADDRRQSLLDQNKVAGSRPSRSPETAKVLADSPVQFHQVLVSRLQLGFALAFFLLALYTKHSLLVAPAAAALAIGLRDKRAALLFTLALGVIGGAIFLAMEIVTRGGWSFSLITANATVWTARVFLPLLQSFVLTYAVLLALAAWSWFRRVLRDRRIGILEIYAGAALLSVALAGREGAWENYFFEVIAMVCVFAGFAFARWQRNARRAWALPALLLVQLALFWNGHDPRIAQQLFDETRAANLQVAPLIQNAQGIILSEDMGLLVTNGKPVEYYTFPYSTLARAGKWDQHWEIENLRAGNFPLVVLRQGTRADVDHLGNFTRAFVSALDYGYDVLWQDAHYQVYVPAPLEYFEPHATFGELFALVGWSHAPDELRAGQTLTLTLVWQALRKPPTRYTDFVHLEDAHGGVIAQDDHEPKDGTYPTTQWAQSEMVRDTFRLRLPSNLKAGEYFLRAGWYDTNTQDRLSLAGGEDFVELKKFTVR